MICGKSAIVQDQLRLGNKPEGEAVDLELQLGHSCTNRCVFCSSGRANEVGRAGFIPREDLFRALAEGAARGARRLTLLGGEPTIHPDFFAVLAEAARLSFPEVVIFTNGALLARPEFLERVGESGRFSWRVSIQGASAEAHDAVTQRRGAFARLERGLDLLKAGGHTVTANTCATARNVDSLPGLAPLAARFDITAWHVDAVRPDDMGPTTPERLAAVLVPYARLAASLRDMLHAFAEWDPEFECSVGGVPFCLLPEWGHRIEHGGEPTLVRDAMGDGALGIPRDKYSVQLAPRNKTPRCDGCAFDARCRGLPGKYLDLFGDGDIAAMSLEELVARDPGRSNLPLILRPWLDRLLALLPEPWQIGSQSRDSFQRVVEVRLEHPSGGGVLRVIPPGAVSPAPDLRIETPECTLVLIENGAGEHELRRLASWMRSHVAAAGPQLPAPESSDAARVDIKIAFDCNNRCEFCVQGNKRELHGPRPVEQIRVDLEDGRRRGALGVVFTGGEPTLQPSLLPSIQYATSLGYRSLQIQSNGRMFAHRPFCEQVVSAGANEFALALHGAQASTHDRLTRAPGSFRQVVTGIRNLTRMGQNVLTNTVITTLNYRELPDIARLLVALGVTQYQFAFVHILGTAAANASWLVPRKSEIMPWVREALDVGRRAGVRCMTEAIPFCFMTGLEDCVAEQIIPRTAVFDADVTMDDYTNYRRTEGKTKGAECRRCAYFDRCEGPWVEYPAQFGWSEFRPVEVSSARGTAHA